MKLTDAVDLETGARRLSDARVARLSDRQLAQLEAELAPVLLRDARACQLAYYIPLHAEARKLHHSTARVYGVQGGRKAGKTDVLLVELAIQMTGLVPLALRLCTRCQALCTLAEGQWRHPGAESHPAEGAYPVAKLRAPIRARLVVTSLTSAWDTNLKPKLQWWEWSGRQNAAGEVGDPACGHWGWIPQGCLVGGDWERSWSSSHRVLTVVPAMGGGGRSTLQIMSFDQALEDFAQGGFQLVLEDELPPEEVHRANRLRTMEHLGRLLVGGTPRDDRTSLVTHGWFFDQVLEPGLSGSEPSEVEASVLWTEANPTLDPEEVQKATAGLSEAQRRTQLHGEPMALSGLVFPGVMRTGRWWCFRCQTDGRILEPGRCGACAATDGVRYRHVWDEADWTWPGPETWPVLFYMDPHQSRPTACAWVKVDPHDGWWQVAELEVAGGAGAVKAAVEGFERAHGLTPRWRKGDPKITAQSNQFAREFEGRPFTIREAFEEVGFDFEDANTNFTVGRERLLSRLRPDPFTRAPRLRIHASCTRTFYQLTHHVWSVSARRTGVDVKDQPERSHSDFPALLRYLANDDPEFRWLERLRTGDRLRLGSGGVGRSLRTGY